MSENTDIQNDGEAAGKINDAINRVSSVNLSTDEDKELSDRVSDIEDSIADLGTVLEYLIDEKNT